MINQQLKLVSAESDGHDRDEHLFASMPCRPISFGEYIALPAARTLTCRGKTVELGGRAFDLLIVLLQSRGALVTRDVIVRYVWPSTIVDESNLRFQMACLRKALGAARDYIKTVPGRGYLFVGDDEDNSRATRVRDIRAQSIDPPRSCRPSIFVVDEDDVIRDALDRLLRSFDADVTSFTSVEALLKNTAQNRHFYVDNAQEQARVAC